MRADRKRRARESIYPVLDLFLCRNKRFRDYIQAVAADACGAAAVAKNTSRATDLAGFGKFALVL
jgi:hypothetical protein